jgi:tetratricopeptide (TPR) repeat protein
MTNALIARLAAAKTDEERSWIVTENLLNSLSPDLASAAWAVAIPHWFDAEMLAALRPELKEQATQLYDKLQTLSFVQEFQERGHNIHELTRNLMLDYLWRTDRKEFCLLSQRSADYFLSSNDSVNQIERLYHLVVTDADKGVDELSDVAQEWQNNFRRAELESLLDVLSEQVTSNRVTTPVRAEICYWKGQAKFRFYLAAEALENYEQALGLFREIGDRLGEANTLRAVGDVLQFKKRSDEALENYQQALGLYREIGDRLGEAYTLKAVGDVLQFQDRGDEALENYEQALGLFREIGDRLGEANTLQAVGHVLQFKKRSDQALENYQQALGLYREIGDRLGEANTLRAVGHVLQFQDRRDQALENYQQALGLYREIGDRLGEAYTLQAVGEVLQFQDRRDQALENYQQALGLFREIGSRLGEANTLQAVGDVLQFQDRRDEALENYEQALRLYREVGARLGEANVLQGYGNLQEDFSQALEYYQSAQKLYVQIGDKYSQSRNLLYFIANAQRELEQQEEAVNSLTHGVVLAEEIGYEPFREFALQKIAEIRDSRENRIPAGQSILRKVRNLIGTLLTRGSLRGQDLGEEE